MSIYSTARKLVMTAGAAVLLLAAAGNARGAETAAPKSVTIAGTLQSELGCSGDWLPECDKTFLTYDSEDDVWQGQFTVSPGDDQDKKGPRYKAALDGSWNENYGANATAGGADIPLVVTRPTLVKFYYDHKTHWVSDSVNSLIVTALGNFQSKIGCKTDGDAGCLRSWLEDPDGDGTYTWTTTAIPPGEYSVQFAFGESLKDGSPTQTFKVDSAGQEIYFGYNSETKAMTISTQGAPHGSLAKARAHWVTRDTFLWDVVGSPKYQYSLVYSPDATLSLAAAGITGGTEIPLTYSRTGPGGDVFKRFPNLTGYSAFKLAGDAAVNAADLLKTQVALVARDGDGKIVDAAGIQIPGVLDDLFHYSGPLGISWDSGRPTLRVWAPTARKVALELYEASQAGGAAEQTMTYDAGTGVWSVQGTPDWKGKFYLFAVDVYAPSTGKIEHNLVTDPYSLSLSINSRRSQIVDLSDPALAPSGWQAVIKPPLAAPEDAVIYELHIRDFSASDKSVPADLRGTFDAFALPDSNGMRHLRELARAGLTHVHLLPAFDFATVDEDRTTWQTVPETALAALAPDSDQQKLLLAPTLASDGFNWGYDPYHYTVPEGSYSVNPDGSDRIKEFRAMVQALNQAGLRVVMDVVYNHTSASGQADKSVLDKIVPGYYYRLDADGKVENSTCCENTASEHWMMGKLLKDSILTWATQYKVDGFRFDLMGHHMLSNMTELRAALDELTPQHDGVDGRAIYVYGEGWDFGEVAGNARGVNASQQNIGGSGLGVFNDRLRDGVRGGNPFDPVQWQGFVTGLALQPNSAEDRSSSEQLALLLDYKDWIKAGLAGNLADYPLVNAAGADRTGATIFYGGKPVGYTQDPQENIVYVSAHDNETLFDAIQTKAAQAATLTDRVRMNNLAVDLVMLSQGVPFFHAGDELLRSKSLDRNSYNSGDWFNRIDFTGQTNNWGAGLPLNSDANWAIFRPLLANPALRPGPAEIGAANSHFMSLLRVRKSSPLFRLRTGEQVRRIVAFLNNGPEQIPGLIAMKLTDVDALDPNADALIVLFNAAPQSIEFGGADFAGQDWLPYKPLFDGSSDKVLSQASFDKSSGKFELPARTTVIFILAETGRFQAQAATATLAATATAAQATPTEPAATGTIEPGPAVTAEPPSVAATATLSPASPAAPSAPSAGAIATVLAVLVAAVVAGIALTRRRIGR